MFRGVTVLPLFLQLLAVGASDAPYVFTGRDGPALIGKWCRVLHDPDASLAASDVIGREFPLQSTADVPNHGVDRAAHWHVFSIRNGSSEAGPTLSVPYSEIDELTLFMVRDGIPVLIGRTGRAVPWAERHRWDHEYVFELALDPGHEGQYLLRAHGSKAIHVPMVVSTGTDFAMLRAGRNLIIGGFAGIMLVMALYNLFVYLAIRDRSYLLYVLYILAICSAQLTLMGFGPFEMVQGDPWMASRASIMFALLSVLLGLEFARRFMGTKELTPKLDRGARLFHVLVPLDLFILFMVDPWVGYQFAQAISGLSALFLLVMATSALRKGSRQARFFLLAWTAFLLGVIAFILKDAGVLPFNDLTQFAMPIGSAVEGVLLSFGLADRINVLRREKERSQAQALAAAHENERIIREQNLMLERKVKERTHALEESNEHLKRTQTQLVNAEKMASLGQLTAGIAHEINNPINFITSNIAPLRRNIGEIIGLMENYRTLDAREPQAQLAALREQERKLGIQESIDELDDIITSIAEGSQRTAEIVRGLRNFSRLDEDDLKDSDLNEGIRSTLTVLAPQFRDQVDFSLDLGELPKVECFPGKVNQVFMNILTNAAQATVARSTDGPRTVQVISRAHGDSVTVIIRDNGTGMDDSVRARIYEPFFTTKAVGEGTGLGMAIVYGIVQEHQGHIDLESTLGAGTEFRITLPVAHPRRNAKRA